MSDLVQTDLGMPSGHQDEIPLPEEGESTAEWVFRESGFMGTDKQLTCCARCGHAPVQRHDKPRHYCDVLKPTMHFICDDCFDALPQ